MTTFLSSICSKCGENGYNCKCENFHPNIEGLVLNNEECQALNNFLYSVGYISHEFHPMIHEISKKIDNYLKTK